MVNLRHDANGCLPLVLWERYGDLTPYLPINVNGRSMRAGLVDIPMLHDPLGSIGVAEGSFLLPFEVRRFYFIRDVPRAATRGSHAHKVLNQLMIAVNGSVEVELDDGETMQKFSLAEPDVGLHIPPGYWRTLRNFAPGTVVAVLASNEYLESDYIRDYEDFRSWSKRA